ncbi:hypothetical protein [Actinoplanes sp. L3-i22]|uniref:hypothetical protein n=1 Tax=Actinoplanes sp. L3-i22 TaxID=2836373 RepID=UPI001C741DA2|nr:hypothetical protein [Actinoplanes sp. L3-i22]BCY09288.1 hypothetical protein L3i22_043760 [Actinoplanes sp. L3-i22]
MIPVHVAVLRHDAYMDTSSLIALGSVAVAAAAAAVAAYQAVMAKRQARSAAMQADVESRSLVQLTKADKENEQRRGREAIICFSEALADLNTMASGLLNQYRSRDMSTFSAHDAMKSMYGKLRYVGSYAGLAADSATELQASLVDESNELAHRLVDGIRDLRPRPVIAARHRVVAPLLKIVEQLRENNVALLVTIHDEDRGVELFEDDKWTDGR